MKAEKFLNICRKWCHADESVLGAGRYCSGNDITCRVFDCIFYSHGKAYFCSAAVGLHAVEKGTSGIKPRSLTPEMLEADFKTYEIKEVCFLMDVGWRVMLFKDCKFSALWQEEDWLLSMSFTGQEPVDLGSMVSPDGAVVRDASSTEPIKVQALPDGLSCSKRGRSIRKALRACFRAMCTPLAGTRA